MLYAVKKKIISYSLYNDYGLRNITIKDVHKIFTR